MTVSTLTQFDSDSDESALLRAARAGSRGSLGELLQSYRAYLAVIAEAELGPDLRTKASASDLIQDSFVEAQRDIQKFAGGTPEEFRAWLRRILLNNVANLSRSFRQTDRRDVAREIPLSPSLLDRTSGGLDTGNSTPSGVVMRDELSSAMDVAIQSLPSHYRDVITWRNYERQSFEVIGQRLQRSPEAARKLWVRALEVLKGVLDSFDDNSAHGS